MTRTADQDGFLRECDDHVIFEFPDRRFEPKSKIRTDPNSPWAVVGGALFEAVDFGNGRIANPHFAQYRVPRFPDVPRIETVVLDRKDLPPAGAGETPLVAVAPAIGNAIFAASGIRLRGLPLAPEGLPTEK